MWRKRRRECRGGYLRSETGVDLETLFYFRVAVGSCINVCTFPFKKVHIWNNTYRVCGYDSDQRRDWISLGFDQMR